MCVFVGFVCALSWVCVSMQWSDCLCRCQSVFLCLDSSLCLCLRICECLSICVNIFSCFVCNLYGSISFYVWLIHLIYKNKFVGRVRWTFVQLCV